MTESVQSQPDSSHNGESGKMRVATLHYKDKDNIADGPRQTNLASTTSSHTFPSSKGKCLAKVIGRKALTECNLNGLAVTALLDSGAQVSMIDRHWKNKYLPEVTVNPLSEILGDEEELKVYAVNGDIIPFDGWIALTVNLKGNENPDLSVAVPFLVSSIALERPVLGFNILEEMIQRRSQELLPMLITLLCNAFSLPEETAELVVHLVQASEPTVQCGRVRTGKHETVIPAGQVTWVKCSVPPHLDLSSSVVLFEPDESNVQLAELNIGEGLLEIQNPKKPYVTLPVGNHTKHMIVLPRKTALGTIQSVEKVILPDQTDLPKPKLTLHSAILSPVSPNPSPWQPNVDLSHLNEEQRAVVNKMLCEEAGAFASDENEIGCIPSLQMSIILQDEVPVQKTYSSIPKPLFREVKQYIQELLLRGWITKSISPYAAPVVCVRKKDGSL